jgi:hypothetical protein
MFPGGNSSKGFFSYYNYILPQEEARRIFIIKGGPGVGKSTFMKKTGYEVVDRGYDVEFMHCSSDNGSLDGIVIPKLGVAMIDGTAPHVVDPKNPGAVDEIIHLGDFWNEAGMVKYRNEIIKTNREVGELFGRAYKYLKSAYCIYEDIAEIYCKAVKMAEFNRIAERLLQQIFTNIGTADKTGSIRKLFVSAITPDGLKSFSETITNGYKCVKVKDIPGISTSKLLEKAADAAVEKGFNAEGYYCAFIPDKLEHLVIPELGISITSSNTYHDLCEAPFMEYDLNSTIDMNVLESYDLVLDYDRCEFDELLSRAVKTIGEAKALHDLMEKYYIPNMDFESVQICWESTMDRILGYSGDK